jgi:hypothetical protein
MRGWRRRREEPLSWVAQKARRPVLAASVGRGRQRVIGSRNEATMKTARVLSMMVAALAALAPLGGLFIPHLYRDNAWIAAA